MKPGAPSLQSSRLLDQVRERIRYAHYSLKTEKACQYLIRFSAEAPFSLSGIGHPLGVEMGTADAHAHAHASQA